MVDIKEKLLTSITGLASATNLKLLNLSFNLLENFTIENSSLENILLTQNELVSFDSSIAVNLKTINSRCNIETT